MAFMDHDIDGAVTPELKAMARRTNLYSYFTSKGIELHKEDEYGRYRVLGNGGLIIQEHWYYRHCMKRGGNPIDCLMNEFGLNFREAVSELTGHYLTRELVLSTVDKKNESKRKEDYIFKMPMLNKNQHRAFAYLNKTRGIKKELIAWLLKQGLLVQEKNHGNCGFPYINFEGDIVGAEWVGTLTNKRFKKIDKNTKALSAYWFILGEPKKLAVYECPIDLLSYITLVRDYPGTIKDPIPLKDTLFLSMSGLKYTIPEAFINHDYFNFEEVYFCIDQDENPLPSEMFLEHFKDLSIPYGRKSPMNLGKDWNEVLQNVIKTLKA